MHIVEPQTLGHTSCTVAANTVHSVVLRAEPRENYKTCVIQFPRLCPISILASGFAKASLGLILEDLHAWNFKMYRVSTHVLLMILSTFLYILVNIKKPRLWGENWIKVWVGCTYSIDIFIIVVLVCFL